MAKYRVNDAGMLVDPTGAVVPGPGIGCLAEWARDVANAAVAHGQAEANKTKSTTPEQTIRQLLALAGDDPEREGLAETPARVLKAYTKWFGGYSVDVPGLFKTFEDGSEHYDQLILQRNIPVWSHCEHHMAPIIGVAHVGYVPDKRIVGLSKLTRLVDAFSRRLQVQERITTQVADALVEHLKPLGVAVVLECRHLCMESRGVCVSNVPTTTQAVRGVFMDKPEARAEFLDAVGRPK
jgi:GTP cyclohydrolase I